jgi:hypothetical protein
MCAFCDVCDFYITLEKYLTTIYDLTSSSNFSYPSIIASVLLSGKNDLGVVY